MKRLFFAIDIPAEVRDAILDASSLIRRRLVGVKWVDKGNIHLTMKFLGNTADSELEEICRRAEVLAGCFEPMALEMDGLGAFPSPGKPRIIWVGLSGVVDRLATLAEELETEMCDLGFASEGRPFRAHVTLGRARRKVRPEPLADGVFSFAEGARRDFIVPDLVLYASQLTREGPIYTVVRKFAFSGGE